MYVEGRFQSREYEDNDGITRKAYEIVAGEVKFLNTKSEAQAIQNPKQSGV